MKRHNHFRAALRKATVETLESRRLLAAQLGTGAGPEQLTAVNGTLYFTVNDGTHGRELWRTDGTSAGTTLVADVNAGGGSSDPAELTNVNGTLFFTAFDPKAGRELWKSDGTTAGTVRVADINPGAGSSDPSHPTLVGGTVFFAADDGATGFELWKTSGNPGSVSRVLDIEPGSGNSFPGPMKAIGNTLYFFVNQGGSKGTLWASDGTAQGTKLVKQISTNADQFSASDLTEFNGELYFVSYEAFGDSRDGIERFSLWKSDGTAAGTAIVHGAGDLPISDLVVVGSSLFFTTNSALLWQTDGTPDGTSEVGLSGDELVNVQGTLFFSRFSTQLGSDSNGIVKDFESGSTVTGLTGVGAELYFVVVPATGAPQLWKSDGTTDGTVRVSNVTVDGGGPAGVHQMVDFKGTLFFAEADLAAGRQLWSTNGSDAHTSVVKDISTPGIITVEGSDDSERIVVTVNGTNLEVRGGLTAFGNGLPNALLQVVPLSSVVRVDIRAFNGDNLIDFSDMAIPTSVDAGTGWDHVDGGSGSDTIVTGAGNDSVWGNDGADRISAGDGDDTVSGGAQKDTLDGGMGNDRLNGNGGNDRLFGGPGGDRLYGYDGNDYLDGGSSKDRLDGGAGSDTMLGQGGSDRFYNAGDNAADQVFGGSNKDTAQNDPLDALASVETVA